MKLVTNEVSHRVHSYRSLFFFHNKYFHSNQGRAMSVETWIEAVQGMGSIDNILGSVSNPSHSEQSVWSVPWFLLWADLQKVGQTNWNGQHKKISEYILSGFPLNRNNLVTHMRTPHRYASKVSHRLRLPYIRGKFSVCNIESVASILRASCEDIIYIYIYIYIYI